MILTIIIFSIATIGALGMLLFRVWEIRTSRIVIDKPLGKHIPELSFRYIEKILLFLIKHLIQWIVLSSVKIWYLFISKTKIFIQNKLPKINKFFEKKTTNGTDSRKISFVERAVMESKIKIKKVKEKIRKEHEEKLEENKEEVDKIL